MPTLRNKVDVFCRDSAAKVDSDKLRRQVLELKAELKAEKAKHKFNLKAVKDAAKTEKVKAAPKAKTVRVKMTDEEKAQRRRERAVVKELEKAKAPKALPEPMMPAPTVPVAAPSLAPAKGGRRKTRRPVMRW